MILRSCRRRRQSEDSELKDRWNFHILICFLFTNEHNSEFVRSFVTFETVINFPSIRNFFPVILVSAHYKKTKVKRSELQVTSGK